MLEFDLHARNPTAVTNVGYSFSTSGTGAQICDGKYQTTGLTCGPGFPRGPGNPGEPRIPCEIKTTSVYTGHV